MGGMSRRGRRQFAAVGPVCGETNKTLCQEVVCGQERPGRWLKPCTRAIAWVDCGAFWTGLWRAQCSSCHRANMPKRMACSG